MTENLDTDFNTMLNQYIDIIDTRKEKTVSNYTLDKAKQCLSISLNTTIKSLKKTRALSSVNDLKMINDEIEYFQEILNKL